MAGFICLQEPVQVRSVKCKVQNNSHFTLRTLDFRLHTHTSSTPKPTPISPIADNYDRVESDAKTLWQLGYPAVTRFLSPLEMKQILDFGCGTGNFSRYLNDKGAKVTGVDISGGMIGVSKKNSPGGEISYYEIKPGDLSRFRDRSFDRVRENDPENPCGDLPDSQE